MPTGISASTPGDQPPHTLVNVVKRDLGEDLGERDSTGDLRIPGDQRRERKGIETASSPPTDGLGDGPYLGIGRSDKMIETSRGPTSTGLDDFDDSQSDCVASFGVDQDEASGVPVI